MSGGDNIRKNNICFILLWMSCEDSRHSKNSLKWMPSLWKYWW